MKIVTVEQMRAIEGASVERGASLDQLQRNAAAAIAGEIESLFGSRRGVLVVLAGPGNNGRDALIAAAMLQESGWEVRALLTPTTTSEDVLQQLRDRQAAVHVWSDSSDEGLLRQWIREASPVLDGLLGIGAKGAPRVPIAEIIAIGNDEATRSRPAVVAVDLPSGIDGDTGEVLGVALRASHTLSLGCVKAGLLKLPAAEYVGRLLPLDIGLPPGSDSFVKLELLTPESVAPLIPGRPLNAHKGTFGRVLVLAGSRNYVGAAYLCGAGAARSGCGLVTLAVPEWQRTSLAALLPEATYLPLIDLDQPGAPEANAQAVAEALPDCQALAVGPGLGQGSTQSRIVMAVLEANRSAAHLPAVIDADGLNALGTAPRWWEIIGPGHVLTPHPAEMARLTGRSTAEINADRWGAAADAAARWSQIVVLKGAFTVVADPEGNGWVSPNAIPALASGGTGDVLTGAIAGLMAQGAKPVDAARAGVVVHALAAKCVLAVGRTDRLIASDLLPAISTAIAALVRGEGAPT